MKPTLILPLVSFLFVNSSHAALIASYANGSTTGSAAYENGVTSTIATVTHLTSVGMSGEVTSNRTDTGLGTVVIALPGTAPDNNWIYAAANAVGAGGAVSTTDYFALTITLNETATLGSLQFQSVDGSGFITNIKNGGLVTQYSLFASVDSAAFAQVGSTTNSSPWSGSNTPDSNGSPYLGPQSTISFDLSSLGALTIGQTVELRLNLQDGSNISPKTNFLNQIQLTTIPEPSAPLLLGTAALLLGLRRKRRQD